MKVLYTKEKELNNHVIKEFYQEYSLIGNTSPITFLETHSKIFQLNSADLLTML